MKKYLINITMFLISCLLLTSCLKQGLDKLPSFTDANITRFDFEYRWNNNGVFAVVTFSTNAPVISNDTLYVTTIVPAASGSFTSDIRNEATINNIVGYCNLSTAASIEPVNNSQKLGVPGDFSKPASYQVTAADGKTKKTWILVLTLVK